MALDATQPFVWGSGGQRLTPEEILAQRKAAALMGQDAMSTAPVGHWSAGLNRVVQGLMSGYDSYSADQASRQNGLDSASLIAQAMGGAAPASPAVPVTAVPATTPVAAAPVVPNDANAIPGTVGMNQRLADLSQDFIDDNPGTSLSSGVRSTADQARLYAQRGSNPNPVAFPGTSNHERGTAIDIGGMSPVARALLPQYGLAQPVANDPPHVELAPSQMASADPAALPVNAQAAQGYAIPGQAAAPATPQARPINPAIMKLISSPYVSDADKKVGMLLFQNQLEAQQKANDPLRALQILEAQGKVASMPLELQGKTLANTKAQGEIDAMPLDRRSKELANTKAERDLQGEGAMPLSKDERASYGIPEGQPAYKTRSGEIKFGPAGTKITNNVGDAETSFSKEAGKVTAERFNGLVADGQKSKQMMSDMSTLLDLGKNIGTGKGAQLAATLGPYAEAAGINVNGLPDIQAYEAIVNRVAPSLRVAGSGAQSDYELKNFLKSIPSLGNTQEGNELATTVMSGLQQSKILASDIASKALAGEITRTEAEKQLRDLPDPMQPYKDYKARKSNVDSLLQKYGTK